jgi:hypothetical protein
MVKDERRGMIPGIRKPTLLKPVPELLNSMYVLCPDSVEFPGKTGRWEVPVTDSSFPLRLQRSGVALMLRFQRPGRFLSGSFCLTSFEELQFLAKCFIIMSGKCRRQT